MGDQSVARPLATRKSAQIYNKRTSQVKLYYDLRSVGQSVLVSGTHLGPVTIFSTFCNYCRFGFSDLGRPL
jgi:hypothetical protein